MMVNLVSENNRQGVLQFDGETEAGQLTDRMTIGPSPVLGISRGTRLIAVTGRALFQHSIQCEGRTHARGTQTDFDKDSFSRT